MAENTRTIETKSPEQTAALARRLAPQFGAGDVVCLEGPIGAGKTHFARTLINARLPHPEDIPSPTFTLVQQYEAPDLEIWHCDLYRLTHPDEALELGLEEAFETAFCLVEWPKMLAGLLPPDVLTIGFEPGDAPEGRRITFSSDSERWRELLEKLG